MTDTADLNALALDAAEKAITGACWQSHERTTAAICVSAYLSALTAATPPSEEATEKLINDLTNRMKTKEAIAKNKGVEPMTLRESATADANLLSRAMCMIVNLSGTTPPATPVPDEVRKLANEARWESFNSRTDCDQAREFAAWSWVDKLCDALLGKSQGL